MIADNSREAYCRAFRTKRLDTLRYRVYLCIAENPGITDEQIARKLNTPINSITGRVGELAQHNFIEFDDTKNQRNNTCRRSYIAGMREATA